MNNSICFRLESTDRQVAPTAFRTSANGFFFFFLQCSDSWRNYADASHSIFGLCSIRNFAPSIANGFINLQVNCTSFIRELARAINDEHDSSFEVLWKRRYYKIQIMIFFLDYSTNLFDGGCI